MGDAWIAFIRADCLLGISRRFGERQPSDGITNAAIFKYFKRDRPEPAVRETMG
jgi:hypothetical protein